MADAKSGTGRLAAFAVLALLVAGLAGWPAGSRAQPGYDTARCEDNPPDSAGACSDRPLTPRIPYGVRTNPALVHEGGHYRLPDAAVGADYDVDLVEDGGDRYTGRAAGPLPEGLTIDAMGHLSGSPRQAGDFSFVAVIHDASSRKPDLFLPLRLTVGP